MAILQLFEPEATIHISYHIFSHRVCYRKEQRVGAHFCSDICFYDYSNLWSIGNSNALVYFELGRYGLPLQCKILMMKYCLKPIKSNTCLLQ